MGKNRPGQTPPVWPAVDLAVHGEPAGDGGTFHAAETQSKLDERVRADAAWARVSSKITHEADADTACTHGMVPAARDPPSSCPIQRLPISRSRRRRNLSRCR